MKYPTPTDDATLRLLAVYADNLRRLFKAEADYYEANIERRLRAVGLDERQLIELGTQLGDRVIGLLERVLLMVYRRRGEHVWTEHAINRVGEALEGSGLQQRVARPPAICFVDLTGYTRLTEERGDEAAAQIAARLVALVNDISRRRGGQAESSPITGRGPQCITCVVGSCRSRSGHWGRRESRAG